MLFSNIMSDINSGDVNVHDIRAEEATQQVNMACAVFEYAMTLDMADEVDQYVQEAAAEESLPTKSEASGELACEAIVKEITGFYGVVVSNAKKVKTATDRDMKAIIALGKKYNVSASDASDFEGSFAKPVASALVKEYGAGKLGKSISFVNGVFPSARKAHDLMLAFGNSIARLAAVFGISTTSAANDPTVKKQLSLSGVAGEPATDISGLYKKITLGTILRKTDFSGEVGTSTSASASDVADIITYLYVVNQISGVIANNAGNAKKVESYIRSLCKGEGDKKKLAAVNDKAKEWCDSVNTSATTIVKVFSDAVSSLGNVAQGKTKGITECCYEAIEDAFTEDDVLLEEEVYGLEDGEDFFEEAHHRKSNVGALIGSLFGPLGVIIGYTIGNSNWRSEAEYELAKFVKDLADSVEDRNKIFAAKRIDRVVQGCGMVLKKNNLSDEDTELVKKLMADTQALRDLDMSETQDVLNKMFIGDVPEGMHLIHRIPAMTRKAITQWSETAKKYLDKFGKGS